jgi:hypothetical protein
LRLVKVAGKMPARGPPPKTLATPAPGVAPRLPPRNSNEAPVCKAASVPKVKLKGCAASAVSVTIPAPLPMVKVPVVPELRPSTVAAPALPRMLRTPPLMVSARLVAAMSTPPRRLLRFAAALSRVREPPLKRV